MRQLRLLFVLFVIASAVDLITTTYNVEFRPHHDLNPAIVYVVAHIGMVGLALAKVAALVFAYWFWLVRKRQSMTPEIVRRRCRTLKIINVLVVLTVVMNIVGVPTTMPPH